jgi:hypothetical protein
MTVHSENSFTETWRLLFLFPLSKKVRIRGPFENFVDSPCYSETGLCGGAVTVSFSKYLPWQAMHFLQRSTHFSKNVLQTVCRKL